MTDVKKSLQIRRGFGVLLPLVALFVFMAGIWLMMWYQPLIFEDLEYSMAAYDTDHDIIDFINWEGIRNHIAFLYQDCNSRLIDKLPVVFLCLTPKWFYCSVSAIAVGMIMAGIWRLAHLSPAKHPWPAFVTFAALWLLFPWHESMFMLSYSINYVWTSAIAIWVANMALSPALMANPQGRKGWQKGMIAIGYMILGFLLGNLHECMAACLIAGIGILALYSLHDMALNRWMLVIGLSLGFVLTVFLLGTNYRLSHTEIEFNFQNIFRGRFGIPSQMVWPVIIYLMTIVGRWLTAVAYELEHHLGRTATWREIAYALWRSAKRLAMPGEKSMLFLTQALCLFVCLTNICIYSYFGVDRTMTYAVIFSIAGASQFFLIWPFTIGHRFVWIIKGFATVVVALLPVNFVLSLLTQKRDMKEFNEITALWLESGDNIAYFDEYPHIYFPDRNRFTFQIGWTNIMDNNFTLEAYLDPHQEFVQRFVLPADMKDVSEDNVVWIDPEKGLYSIHGHLLLDPGDRQLIVTEHEPDMFPNNIYVHAMATFDDGDCHRVWGQAVPFVDKKGKQRYFLKFLPYSIQELVHQIVSLDDLHIVPQIYHRVGVSSYGTVDIYPYAKEKRIGGVCITPKRELKRLKHNE